MMATFWISLCVFGAAFAALASGPLRGRPFGSHACGDCALQRLTEEGGCDADHP